MEIEFIPEMAKLNFQQSHCVKSIKYANLVLKKLLININIDSLIFMNRMFTITVFFKNIMVGNSIHVFNLIN